MGPPPAKSEERLLGLVGTYPLREREGTRVRRVERSARGPWAHRAWHRLGVARKADLCANHRTERQTMDRTLQDGGRLSPVLRQSYEIRRTQVSAARLGTVGRSEKLNGPRRSR